jgi:hypothetical protein
MAKPGPKPRIYTEQERQLVKRMALAGCTQKVMASVIECTVETLEKHFRKELDDEKAKVAGAIAAKLVQKALEGNMVAMIFYLKTQCGWRETNAVELSGNMNIKVNLVKK